MGLLLFEIRDQCAEAGVRRIEGHQLASVPKRFAKIPRVARDRDQRQITDTLDWHWLFYVNLLPGAAITILAALLVKIDEPDLKLLKEADYPGIVLLAIGLGTLEYVLEEGSRWNWFDDATIRTCAWVAAIAGALFVIRSLTFTRPVVDLRALTNRNFALGCFLSFVTGIGIFSTIYLTPLFLGYVRGFSAPGIAIFSTGAASLAGVPVYIFLARLRGLEPFFIACPLWTNGLG